jgi:hypothetical protein
MHITDLADYAATFTACCQKKCSTGSIPGPMHDADFIAFLEEEESGPTQKALIKPQACIDTEKYMGNKLQRTETTQEETKI